MKNYSSINHQGFNEINWKRICTQFFMLIDALVYLLKKITSTFLFKTNLKQEEILFKWME